MRSPHDAPTPCPPRRPTRKALASGPVPRFTPPPQRPAARLDATISELPPANHLSWAEPPRAVEPVFQLVRVVDGFSLARHVFSQGLVRIGRGDDCDLRLDDKTASRYHALIELHGADYLLHDQLSSNGVKVNGARVDRSCRLRDGDVLLLGATRLVFETVMVPPGPALPALPPAALPPAALPPAALPPTPARARPPVAVERASVAAPAPDATLAPPEDSSEDLVPSPRDDTAAHGIIFGRTLAVSKARLEGDQRESGVAARAYLRAIEEKKRWSASHLGPTNGEHLLARDAFVIGAGEGVDLRVEARLMPRVVAVIVRGLSGFSVSQVAGWPWTTRVNGRVVTDLEPLEDGDVLLVAGRQFTFHVGNPSS